MASLDNSHKKKNSFAYVSDDGDETSENDNMNNDSGKCQEKKSDKKNSEIGMECKSSNEDNNNINDDDNSCTYHKIDELKVCLVNQYNFKHIYCMCVQYILCNLIHINKHCL